MQIDYKKQIGISQETIEHEHLVEKKNIPLDLQTTLLM